MWARVWTCVVVLAVVGAAVGEAGFLQINAESGVVVYLDGERVGVTSEELGGLFVVDVPAGERLLRLERDGFEAQELTVRVGAGRVSVHDVGQFAPQMLLQQSGDRHSVALRRLTGTLVVQTLPVESVIDLPGLGLREQRKARDLWQVEHVPVGSYALTVAALGREAQVEVVVVDRHETRVFVSLGSDPPLVTSEQRPIPTHAVERVAPATIRSSQTRQRIEVHGSGFRPGAAVVVYWGEREFVVPLERTAYVDATRIDVEVGLFPADTAWSVVVLDPDGTRSEPFTFAVVD